MLLGVLKLWQDWNLSDEDLAHHGQSFGAGRKLGELTAHEN